MPDTPSLDNSTRALLEAIPQVVWVVGADGALSYGNAHFRSFSGLAESQIAGRSASDASLVHPEDAPRLVELTGAPPGRDPAALEIRLRRSDGVFRWHLGRFASWPAGALPQWLVTATDIEEQKRTSSRLETLLARERDTEERQLQRLFAALPLPCWVARPDGWIYSYNRSWYDYTGTIPDEMEGQGFRSVHDPGRAPQVLDEWHDTLAQGAPFEMMFKLRRYDGAFRWFLTRVNPMRDDAGRIVRWLGTHADVEDQKQAEEAARAANRGKDEFLAMLGHELRNPLSPILTALHLIRLRHPDAATRERAIIERQVAHLSRLVDDLLDVSRITRGKTELKKAPLEIAEAVALGVEMASPLLEQKQHDLHVEVPARGLRVEGDLSRLAQVVGNLLTNAAKYSAPQGRIAILAAVEEGQVVVTVRDSGVGISPELLPHVFELFVQGGQTIERTQGGLGLGLAIVRSLMILHGGSVEAKSAGLGQGSEFTLRLPALGLRDYAPAPAPAPPSDSGAAPVPATPKRILIVDDNSDAAETLAQAVSRMGHVTRIATDGPQALRLIEEFTPQIALLDLGLPVMDGYELARQLLAVEALAGLRLIAVTGYGESADRAQSRQAGFELHLVKPVDLRQLSTVLAG
ncbi:MAG: hypothetical protein NVS2B9_14810 [Myxococcales bacterium]